MKLFNLRGPGKEKEVINRVITCQIITLFGSIDPGYGLRDHGLYKIKACDPKSTGPYLYEFELKN